MWWSAGTEQRIFAGVQSFLYSLDAKTGKPDPGFGNNGRIDLRENLGREASKQSVVLTSPGIIYKDLIIMGGRLPEQLPAPPGDIRAFDTRTGALKWTFHTIPHPGEPGYETWPPQAWTYTGGANSWPGMALDEKRGIVYIPTGSAASDFYGADRHGNNLYANTLLALKADTGQKLWHFQAVRHDIWDRDFPSPPTLITVRHRGKLVDAVAQTSKQGFVYVFDRVTGEPLFPLEEHKYPASTTPGEKAAETQLLPVKPAPFARQTLTAQDLTDRTPEARQWARDKFASMTSAGQFIPLQVDKDTIVFPGYDGGAEWGGSAFDPETGLLYVNANDLAWTGALTANTAALSARQLYLNQCGTCHGESMAGAPPQIPALTGAANHLTEAAVTKLIREGAGRMPAFPALSPADTTRLAQFVLSGQDKELAPVEPAAHAAYRFTGYKKFLDPDGYPAVAPPWGTLNAINLNTGEYAWKIPLGEYPELAQKNTGTENYGGPVVTAGGLLFIGATNFDRKFRAFDKKSGKLLWEDTLPMAGNTTPVTYEAGGRQYVLIYATGGKGKPGSPTGGVFVAYALPTK
jgi:quinoprotein glucose dehydrogenase